MAVCAVKSVVPIPLVPNSSGLLSRDTRKPSVPLLPTTLPSSITSRNRFYSPPLCNRQTVEAASGSLPNSREEALSQARASLASCLEKALRNAGPTTVKQRKLLRQTRLRVEIPLLEDSDETRAGLLVDLFSAFSVGGKRGTAVSLSVFCNSAIMEELEKRSDDLLESPSFQCCDIAQTMELGSTQLVVILAPKLSELTYVVDIAKAVDPRPVLLLNPAWSAQEEESVAPYTSFLQSFDVVYSYLPLVIQGFLSKTEGAVLKHVKSGAPAGRPWLIFAKEGETMKCVSSLKKRPSPADLENALYNAMAANSPLTKSIKFFRGLGGKS